MCVDVSDFSNQSQAHEKHKSGRYRAKNTLDNSVFRDPLKPSTQPSSACVFESIRVCVCVDVSNFSKLTQAHEKHIQVFIRLEHHNNTTQTHRTNTSTSTASQTHTNTSQRCTGGETNTFMPFQNRG